jgi:Spy/CpxP family protein refolding chaperone
MRRVSRITIALALLAAARAPAQQPPGSPSGPGGPGALGGPGGQPRQEDPFARFLFPPELVMQQQRAIGLKPEQRTAITRVIQEFQAKILDLQWQMQDETQRFAELLDKPVVDQAAALAQIDKVLAVERDVKRAHIGLLIAIKNNLTAEQQARLAQARSGGQAP